MKNLAIIAIILISLTALGQSGGKIIYKYKKFQEFDLEKLDVKGDVGVPVDLSSNSRLQRRFKNRLPLRKNFNPELRRSIEVIR